MKSDLIEIGVYRHAETEKAILVSETGEKADGVWLPKSQIQDESDHGDSYVTLTLPEWLARDKGLI